MDAIKLNNGVDMPVVGFGTWQILFNGLAYNAVAEALEVGYRLIDTARIYGNEKGVGRAIRESEVARNEIFLTTKLWNSGRGYEKALEAFDGSLQRLGLEYIDLYLIHWPAAKKRQEVWQAMEEIYESGRAKAVGVSNYDIVHMREILDSGGLVPAVNQIELHIFNYAEQKQLIEFCQEHGTVIEAYSPLAQATNMTNEIINRLAAKYDKTYAQVMLRWCLQHDTVPLPKSTNPDRIRENFNIFDFEISEEDMRELDNIST